MPGSKFLLAPLQVGTVLTKNRVFMAPLTRDRAENTYPTELMKEYYVQRARDAGLIVSEAILVSRQGFVRPNVWSLQNFWHLWYNFGSTEWPSAPGIWEPKHIESWKNITDAIHEAGGKIFAQVS